MRPSLIISTILFSAALAVSPRNASPDIRFADLPFLETRPLSAYFIDQVAKRTEEEISSISATSSVNLSKLKVGDADIGLVLLSDLSSTEEGAALNLFNMPFAFFDANSIAGVQSSSAGQSALASLRNKGSLVPLAYWNLEAVHFFSEGELLNDIAAFMNAKVATYREGFTGQVFRAVGAESTSPNAGTLPDYLRVVASGEFDAWEMPLEATTRDLGAQGAIVSETPLRFVSVLPVVREDFWRAASERLRMALIAAAADTAGLANATLFERDAQARKKTAKLGVAFQIVPKDTQADFQKASYATLAAAWPSFDSLRDLGSSLAIGGINLLHGASKMMSAVEEHPYVPLVGLPVSVPCTHESAWNLVFVATNRKTNTGESDAVFVYEPRLNPTNDLHFGLARVEVDANRPRGSSSTAEIRWRTYALIPSKDAFLQLLKQQAACTDGADQEGEPSVLIFVHGFNTPVHVAVRRSAHLASEIGFGGPVVSFIWPADVSPTGYVRDANMAEVSEPHFAQVMGMLREYRSIVIAHSMGSRIAANGSVQFVNRGTMSPGPSRNQLILAAPEISRIRLRQVVPVIKDTAFRRITLYASDEDDLLKLARAVAGDVGRAGEVGEQGILLVQGLDSIDASNANTDPQGFHHSYISDSSHVLHDLEGLIIHAMPPGRRGGLSPARTATNQEFWQLR